jgi:hypothetical protein
MHAAKSTAKNTSRRDGIWKHETVLPIYRDYSATALGPQKFWR